MNSATNQSRMTFATIGQDDFDVVRILQETDTSVVEEVLAPDGTRLARKQYKTVSRFVDLELDCLRTASDFEFRHLQLPKLVRRDKDSLLMTYVDREHQTRESILERVWTRQDVACFVCGIKEFQRLKPSSQAYSFKQKIAGLAYPVWRLAFLMRPCLRERIVGWRMLPRLAFLGLRYLMARTFFRNCIVHYDLSTLNCALTPKKRLSILDFEFAYYLGDPLFDICYYVTIPPQSLQDWTYQVDLIGEFIKAPPLFASLRLQLILIVCTLVRTIHFENGSKEREQYLRSLDVLFDGKQFTHVYQEFLRRPAELGNDAAD